MMTSMYALVYGEEYIKPASERVIVRAAKVYLYAKIGEKSTILRSVVVSNSSIDYPTVLKRNIHGSSLPLNFDHDMDVFSLLQ